MFGGQVASQALRAAWKTVEVPHLAHSLHAYFLRPGEPGVPIVYQVHRIRDGRSFTTRRVVAIQRGEAIFNLAASFHKAEPGPEYQLPPPAAPSPEELPAGESGRRHHRPIETREISLGDQSDDDAAFSFSTRRVWLRTAGSLPDDPAIHACAIAYASDSGPIGASRRPHQGDGGGPFRFMSASLDHSMWFHHQVRADKWLLYDLQAVASAGARGLARGTMHTADGLLAVTVSQEALLRPRR